MRPGGAMEASREFGMVSGKRRYRSKPSGNAISSASLRTRSGRARCKALGTTFNVSGVDADVADARLLRRMDEMLGIPPEPSEKRPLAAGSGESRRLF